jgi:hypothetical protein
MAQVRTKSPVDGITGAPVRISANVTDDFGNVTGLGPVLGCADLIVEMGSV